MDVFKALNTNRRSIFRTISDRLDYKNRQLLYRAESLFVRRSVQKHKYTVWAEVEFLNVKPCSEGN